MNRPGIRLLALDLDGTVLRSDGHISKRVQKAITQAQERGSHIALATGRSFQSALPFARLMGIHQPLICYQGGLIRHPDTGETLSRTLLAPGLIEEAIHLSQLHDWHLILYTDDEVLLTEYRHPLEVYHQMLGPTFRLVTDFRSAIDGGAIKLTWMSDELDTRVIETEMNLCFAGRMQVFRSHPMFVEGIPPGVSKGTALAWLASHLGIPRHGIMAIGDQDNDTSMMAWAGLGVAMGNGSQRCKQAADWVAPTIDEDGAAFAIERFVL